MPPMFKFVLIKLADHAKDNGSDVRPSFSTVASECGVAYKTVQRAVAYAKDRGWLLEVETPGNKPNEYAFDMDSLAQAQAKLKRGTAVGPTVQPVCESSRSDSPAGLTVQPVPESTSVGPTVHLSRSHSPPTYKGRTVIEPSGNHQSLDASGDASTFADFWAEYPKRAGDRKRAAAEAKWKLAIKRGVDPGLIVAGAKRYRAFCDATGKTGTEYIQQAPTWLNGRAWENEFELPAEPPKLAAAPRSDEPDRLGTRATREGRLVYTWQGRDLTIDEAVRWHEERNRALPPELERALEAA